MRRTALFARPIVLFAVGAILLCAPACYNGYPLIFPDLLDYGVDGMRIVRWQWPGGNHPPFYGLAIELLHLERSLWPVIFVQGFIVNHLLYVVLRSIGLRLAPLAFLAVIAGLTLLTSLPWYVSVVMPDVFGGTLVLCLFLLISRPTQLTLIERIYVAGLAIASLLFHVSFVPVAIGILAIATTVAILRRRQPNRPHLATTILVLLAALIISGLVSIKFWGSPAGPPNAPPYLLAHVLVDGPGKHFLQRQCTVERFVLCDYQDAIPNDVEEFMFRAYSPYFSSWQTRKIRSEAPAIVLGTLKMFPLQTIVAAVRDALTQIVTFRTEVAQLEEIPNDRGGSFGTEFAIRLPFIAKGYVDTAQARGMLSDDNLRVMNDLDAAIVLFSAVLVLYSMLTAAKRRDWPIIELLTIILAGIVINGLVAGAAVGVFDRFGARIIWLLPFAAVASTAQRVRYRLSRGRAYAPITAPSQVGTNPGD